MQSLFEVKNGTEQILLSGLPLTDLLTVLTFLLLIITIIVSVRALKETARSNILSSSPVLVLKYLLTRNEHDAIQVENVGHGTALNVRVESYYTTFLDDVMFIKGSTIKSNKPIHAILRFQPIDLLLEGKTLAFDTSKSKGSGFFTPEILANQMMTQRGKLTFRLRYSDITGAQYISKITISQNRIRVAGHPKRYNTLRKVIYVFYLCKEKIKMITIFWPIAYYRQRKVNRELKEKHINRNSN